MEARATAFIFHGIINPYQSAEGDMEISEDAVRRMKENLGGVNDPRRNGGHTA
jgi:hypothetical protein